MLPRRYLKKPNKPTRHQKIAFLGAVSFLFALTTIFVFNSFDKEQQYISQPNLELTDSEQEVYEEMLTKTEFATEFNYPVSWPDAEGFHDLQPFGENNHLGEDWNDEGPCDSDLGKPVYAIADGYIVSAKNHFGGWGNVVRIAHKYKENGEEKIVESLYAHLDEITVTPDSKIESGQQIGTIGNVNGKYCAHLHFELRVKLNMPLGGGYSKNQEGFLSPSLFIKSHRKI